MTFCYFQIAGIGSPPCPHGHTRAIPYKRGVLPTIILTKFKNKANEI